jgi:hypothetical protein
MAGRFAAGEAYDRADSRGSGHAAAQVAAAAEQQGDLDASQ